MIRGLVFSKYGNLAASTRQRFVLAEDYLREAGIALEFSPLFDNEYLKGWFESGTRHRKAVLLGYIRRVLALLRAGRFDFLWVHCELFPYLPLEWLIKLSNRPVIYDYDDAIFHQYDHHARGLVRKLLGKKLRPLLRHAQLALCGNPYLRDYAAKHCRWTEIVPTTVDVQHLVPGPGQHVGCPRLGWIGSPSTWPYCQPLLPLLGELVESKQLEVLIVGAQHARRGAFPFDFRDWSEASELADLQSMDIGVMPIPDEPWARGKCGYKLIQYMACGIPVVASPVGVNTEIVEHGVNGFLASSLTEWRDAIQRLASDPSLRGQMGQRGRAIVEERYSIQQHAPRMARLIHQVCR